MEKIKLPKVIKINKCNPLRLYYYTLENGENVLYYAEGKYKENFVTLFGNNLNEIAIKMSNRIEKVKHSDWSFPKGNKIINL